MKNTFLIPFLAAFLFGFSASAEVVVCTSDVQESPYTPSVPGELKIVIDTEKSTASISGYKRTLELGGKIETEADKYLTKNNNTTFRVNVTEAEGLSTIVQFKTGFFSKSGIVYELTSKAYLVVNNKLLEGIYCTSPSIKAFAKKQKE